LPIEAGRVVPSEPDDEQAAGLGSSWTELDVDASAGHLCGHGDRTVLAGAGDDLRLDSVVLRVQHPRFDTQLGEQSGEALRIGHAAGTDEYRLSRIMAARTASAAAVSRCSKVTNSRSGTSSRMQG